jgi:hypothetical protein
MIVAAAAIPLVIDAWDDKALCVTRFCPLYFLMPAELATIDAEDLKSRLSELRRFL